MAGPAPPRGFSSAPLDIHRSHVGERWWRLYRAAYPNPLGFGYAPSRFSDPRASLAGRVQFAIVYLGSSIATCFAETIVRDRRNAALGEIFVSRAELETWAVAEIVVAEPLDLVNLTGDATIRMGVPTDVVRANSHSLGRRWSVAFWQHGRMPDGVHYRSRLTEDFNLGVYDRAVGKLRVTTTRRLLDHQAELTQIIRQYRLAVV